MLTPGSLMKMVPEIVEGLRDIRQELKALRTGMDRGFADMVGEVRRLEGQIDHINAHIERAMGMATSVLEDESVLRGDASPQEVLRRAAAAARGAPKPAKRSR